MGTSHSNHIRRVLPSVRFPQKGISLDDTRSSGRLLRSDLIMKVRPAASAPFLTDQPDWLAHRDLAAQLHARIDRIQMKVPVKPAPLVENDNSVVANLCIR